MAEEQVFLFQGHLYKRDNRYQMHEEEYCCFWASENGLSCEARLGVTRSTSNVIVFGVHTHQEEINNFTPTSTDTIPLFSVEVSNTYVPDIWDYIFEYDLPPIDVERWNVPVDLLSDDDDFDEPPIHVSIYDRIPENSNSEDKIDTETSEICVVCQIYKPVIMLLPCKHICFCRFCNAGRIIHDQETSELQSNYEPECPLCRTTIVGTVVID